MTNTRGCHGLEPVAVSVGSTIYGPVVMVDNWFEGGIEISEAEEDHGWVRDEMNRNRMIEKRRIVRRVGKISICAIIPPNQTAIIYNSDHPPPPAPPSPDNQSYIRYIVSIFCSPLFPLSSQYCVEDIVGYADVNVFLEVIVRFDFGRLSSHSHSCTQSERTKEIVCGTTCAISSATAAPALHQTKTKTMRLLTTNTYQLHTLHIPQHPTTQRQAHYTDTQ